MELFFPKIILHNTFQNNTLKIIHPSNFQNVFQKQNFYYDGKFQNYKKKNRSLQVVLYFFFIVTLSVKKCKYNYFQPRRVYSLLQRFQINVDIA